jgi:hypothetical protein
MSILTPIVSLIIVMQLIIMIFMGRYILKTFSKTKKNKECNKNARMRALASLY